MSNSTNRTNLIASIDSWNQTAERAIRKLLHDLSLKRDRYHNLCGSFESDGSILRVPPIPLIAVEDQVRSMIDIITYKVIVSQDVVDSVDDIINSMSINPNVY